MTAKALNNTGAIAITGDGTVQSTWTSPTQRRVRHVAVETGSVCLDGDALLEFASGQIGTIDGAVELDGANARIADAGTLATNSALTGLNTVRRGFLLENGSSVAPPATWPSPAAARWSSTPTSSAAAAAAA